MLKSSQKWSRLFETEEQHQKPCAMSLIFMVVLMFGLLVMMGLFIICLVEGLVKLILAIVGPNDLPPAEQETTDENSGGQETVQEVVVEVVKLDVMGQYSGE